MTKHSKQSDSGRKFDALRPAVDSAVGQSADVFAPQEGRDLLDNLLASGDRLGNS